MPSSPRSPLRVDVQVERGPGRAVAADELDVAALLEDEQPAVGRELHRGGAAQPRDDRGLGEAGRQRRRGPPPLQPLEPKRPGRTTPATRATASPPPLPAPIPNPLPPSREEFPDHGNSLAIGTRSERAELLRVIAIHVPILVYRPMQRCSRPIESLFSGRRRRLLCVGRRRSSPWLMLLFRASVFVNPESWPLCAGGTIGDRLHPVLNGVSQTKRRVSRPPPCSVRRRDLARPAWWSDRYFPTTG